MKRSAARLACVALLALAAGAGSSIADPGNVTHDVQEGETLSSIAASHFGNPHLWPALYRANRDQIQDPARLYPGQMLSIPLIPVTTTRRAAEKEGGESAAVPTRRVSP